MQMRIPLAMANRLVILCLGRIAPPFSDHEFDVSFGEPEADEPPVLEESPANCAIWACAFLYLSLPPQMTLNGQVDSAKD
jgi:hypothetical protein